MNEIKYRRKAPHRPAREEVLVVCGGQTEQLYFDAFKQVFRPSLGSISVITAVEAKSPVQIVEFAIKARQRKDSYNAVWSVFDKDDFTDFDDAIVFAKQNGIRAAFSNQAFEVWLINHFRRLDSAMQRNRYKEELSKLLSFPYDKSRETMSNVCDSLLTKERVKAAIVNTRLGYERHKAFTIPQSPSAYDSCTTVYLLADSLLHWGHG
jgi:hypothetical protein